MQYMFTVYDHKAAAYLPPFFLPTVDMALRAFADCIQSPEHQFGRHPHDYTLYEIGGYDDSSGNVTVSKHKSLGNGVEFIANSNDYDLHQRPPGQNNGQTEIDTKPPVQPD